MENLKVKNEISPKRGPPNLKIQEEEKQYQNQVQDKHSALLSLIQDGDSDQERNGYLIHASKLQVQIRDFLEKQRGRKPANYQGDSGSEIHKIDELSRESSLGASSKTILSEQNQAPARSHSQNKQLSDYTITGKNKKRNNSKKGGGYTPEKVENNIKFNSKNSLSCYELVLDMKFNGKKIKNQDLNQERAQPLLLQQEQNQFSINLLMSPTHNIQQVPFPSKSSKTVKEEIHLNGENYIFNGKQQKDFSSTIQKKKQEYIKDEELENQKKQNKKTDEEQSDFTIQKKQIASPTPQSQTTTDLSTSAPHSESLLSQNIQSQQQSKLKKSCLKNSSNLKLQISSFALPEKEDSTNKALDNILSKSTTNQQQSPSLIFHPPNNQLINISKLQTTKHNKQQSLPLNQSSKHFPLPPSQYALPPKSSKNSSQLIISSCSVIPLQQHQLSQLKMHSPIENLSSSIQNNSITCNTISSPNQVANNSVLSPESNKRNIILTPQDQINILQQQQKKISLSNIQSKKQQQHSLDQKQQLNQQQILSKYLNYPKNPSLDKEKAQVISPPSFQHLNYFQQIPSSCLLNQNTQKEVTFQSKDNKRNCSLPKPTQESLLQSALLRQQHFKKEQNQEQGEYLKRPPSANTEKSSLQQNNEFSQQQEINQQKEGSYLMRQLSEKVISKDEINFNTQIKDKNISPYIPKMLNAKTPIIQNNQNNMNVSLSKQSKSVQTRSTATLQTIENRPLSSTISSEISDRNKKWITQRRILSENKKKGNENNAMNIEAEAYSNYFNAGVQFQKQQEISLLNTINQNKYSPSIDKTNLPKSPASSVPRLKK